MKSLPCANPQVLVNFFLYTIKGDKVTEYRGKFYLAVIVTKISWTSRYEDVRNRKKIFQPGGLVFGVDNSYQAAELTLLPKFIPPAK
jgi:hypothetical protein